MPVAVPSSETPNQPGSVLLPPAAFESQFLPSREMSYDDLRSLWLGAGAAYGVPWQVLAAINKIESNFGRNMGPSSAGAVGWMQFMPDTWLRWGIDGDGDGMADPWNPDDAVYSAARYLAAAEGRTDISRAIFAYNHAQWYVDDVLRLAAMFGGGDGDVDVVFTLDRMAIELDEAQEQVASLGEELDAAVEAESRADRARRRAGSEAHRTSSCCSPTGSCSSRMRSRQTRSGVAASAQVESLREELGLAQSALEVAQSGAHLASFVPAAADLLGMPSRADGYVFPVGGGPDTVSVGHDHHDYPAADIAAPLGSPVFALADANRVEPRRRRRVRDRAHVPVARWLRVGLLPSLLSRQRRPAGLRSLTAGQWVGLVGSTGHSTGPHLHLGLKPARYPQEMPWFQEFAGVAFTWQDAPAETMPGPVFAVVPTDDDPSNEVVEFTLSGS